MGSKMTPEQRAAFVNAQTALLNCEVAGMVAQNQWMAHVGGTPAYDEPAFLAKFREYENVIGYNAVVDLFRD